MNKYSYDMAIAASSEAEADTKMQALTTLASKLSAKELEKLADSNKDSKMRSLMILLFRLNTQELKRFAEVVEKEPLTLAFAKKHLGL